MLATATAPEINIFNTVTIIDWTDGCHLDADGNVKPGIYRGMPDYVYHTTGGYSSSLFKEMATKSAFHVCYSLQARQARSPNAPCTDW